MKFIKKIYICCLALSLIALSAQADTNPNDPTCIRGHWETKRVCDPPQKICQGRGRPCIEIPGRCYDVKTWICDERGPANPPPTIPPAVPGDPTEPPVNPNTGCCFNYTIDYGNGSTGSSCVCLSPNATSTSGNFGTVTQSGGKCYADPASNVDINFVESCGSNSSSGSNAGTTVR